MVTIKPISFTKELHHEWKQRWEDLLEPVELPTKYATTIVNGQRLKKWLTVGGYQTKELKHKCGLQYIPLTLTNVISKLSPTHLSQPPASMVASCLIDEEKKWLYLPNFVVVTYMPWSPCTLPLHLC